MTPRQLKFGLINNNKNKWPFRHPFENGYLRTTPGVCLLAYGTQANAWEKLFSNLQNKQKRTQ